MRVKRSNIKSLTPRQREIVNFINKIYFSKGYAPSLVEIADALGLNAPSTVHQHIKLIQNKGYLKKDEFQPRGIMPLVEENQTVEIPLLGIIKAGNPIMPIENPEPISVQKSMIKDKSDYYALVVKGDSMIDDGIWDGDTILIKHQKNANVGDIIIATSDGEATLKQFGGINNGKAKLIPKNASRYDPYEVDASEFEIRGKFMGLIRRAN